MRAYQKGAGEFAAALLKRDDSGNRKFDAGSHEVAGLIAHLVSDAGAYTTGSSLVVDGGLLLTSVLPLQDLVEAEA